MSMEIEARAAGAAGGSVPVDRMLVVVSPAERSSQVLALLEEHGVHAFTEIPEVAGSGKSGRHLGTRAFPGASSLIFTFLPETKAAELAAALRELGATFSPAEGGLHAFELSGRAVV